MTGDFSSIYKKKIMLISLSFEQGNSCRMSHQWVNRRCINTRQDMHHHRRQLQPRLEPPPLLAPKLLQLLLLVQPAFFKDYPVNCSTDAFHLRQTTSYYLFLRNASLPRRDSLSVVGLSSIGYLLLEFRMSWIVMLLFHFNARHGDKVVA